MQKCVRSKPARMSRHEEVAHLLAKPLVQRGFTVISEPRLRTSGGVKVPDLVTIASGCLSALVLEVAICNSTGVINSRYTDKLVKYDTEEVKECITLETIGLTAGAIEVHPVVLNFRGVMSPVSRQMLRMAGLTDDELTWLEFKTLKGSARVFRQWRKACRRGACGNKG